MKFQKGNKLGKKFVKGYKRGKLSEEHKRKISETKKGGKAHKMMGANNPAWKGGVTGIAWKIRKDLKYRLWRSDVFTRDNYTCQECGQKGVRIQAHHLKPFAQIIKEYHIKTLSEALYCEELWDINNGQTLCSECHRKTDSFKRPTNT